MEIINMGMEFKEEMLAKIDDEQALTEKELSRLVRYFGVETSGVDVSERVRINTTIVKIKNRFFAIKWKEDPEGNHEEIFDEQPIEVEQKAFDEVVTVMKWVRK